MKAAVVERYGPPEVAQIREVPKPVPADDEILVRVTATTVNSGDARIRAMRVPRGMTLMFRLSMGWNGPKQKVLGFDCAGVVESVGANVSQFKAGDRVVGSHGFRFGMHAEYTTFTERDALVPIPEGMNDTDAVAVLFGGSTARSFFQAGSLKAGERLLVNGASGAVGVYAIQLAKHIGAEVTAVCSSANADLVRSLGADHVIAYDHEDFTQNGQTYDVIMDNHGNAPFSRIRHMLPVDGRFLMVIADIPQMIAGKFEKRVVDPGSDDSKAVNKPAYNELLSLVQQGVLKPVIDRILPFEEIAEAHRIVDSGRKRGSLVVTVP